LFDCRGCMVHDVAATRSVTVFVHQRL
jgi:hypothetical protein